MFQAYPAPWTTSPAMDAPYDGVTCSFSPALSQTLFEVDIDNSSIHTLFDGLPDIFEPDGHYAGAVTVASSPPSTPPAQGSRPTSKGGIGSLLLNNPVHDQLAATTLARPSATQQQPVLVKPELPLPPITMVTNRRVGGGSRRAGKACAAAPAPARRGKAKVKPALSKVLEAKPLPTASFVPTVARIVPKILPEIAVDQANEHLLAAGHPQILRLAALQPAVCLPRAPKRSRRADAPSLPMENTRTQKTRYFDKVEHVVRERWRRDDMAGKFLVLESLLPPSSKRDRSTIVEDSMKLVKSLQHRKEEARKRRAELQQAVKNQAQSGVKLSEIIQKIGSLAVMNPPQHQPIGRLLQSTPGPLSRLTSRGLQSTSTGGAKLEPGLVNSNSAVPKYLSDCVHRFYVHQSDLSTGDIVIQMICEPVPNLHSSLLKSMESLGLEVLNCNLTKTLNKFICNITVKPFQSSASVSSSSTSNIMEGLSSAFQKE